LIEKMPRDLPLEEKKAYTSSYNSYGNDYYSKWSKDKYNQSVYRYDYDY